MILAVTTFVEVFFTPAGSVSWHSVELKSNYRDENKWQCWRWGIYCAPSFLMKECTWMCHQWTIPHTHTQGSYTIKTSQQRNYIHLHLLRLNIRACNMCIQIKNGFVFHLKKNINNLQLMLTVCSLGEKIVLFPFFSPHFYLIIIINIIIIILFILLLLLFDLPPMLLILAKAINHTYFAATIEPKSHGLEINTACICRIRILQLKYTSCWSAHSLPRLRTCTIQIQCDDAIHSCARARTRQGPISQNYSESS